MASASSVLAVSGQPFSTGVPMLEERQHEGPVLKWIRAFYPRIRQSCLSLNPSSQCATT